MASAEFKLSTSIIFKARVEKIIVHSKKSYCTTATVPPLLSLLNQVANSAANGSVALVFPTPPARGVGCTADLRGASGSTTSNTLQRDTAGHRVAWRDAVQHDAAKCRWCSARRHGAARHSAASCCVSQHDAMQCCIIDGMCDSMQHGAVDRGTVLPDAVLSDAVRRSAEQHCATYATVPTAKHSTAQHSTA